MLKYILKGNLLILLLLVTMFLFPSNFVRAKQISMNRSRLTISIGTITTLEVNTKQKIKWTSSNHKVVSVNNMGKVIAKKEGIAKVKAQVNNKVYTCIVIVDNLRLNRNSVELEAGETVILNAIGTKRSIDWESMNETIVNVEKGEIVAINPGTTEVIASVGRDTERICKVTVVPKRNFNVEAMYFKENTLELDTKWQTKRLMLEVLPFEANNFVNITWSSSNPTVAAVNQQGTVTAMSNGTATICAEADNGVKVYCIVNSRLVKEVKEISLDKSELKFSNLQEQYRINTVITPYDAQEQSLIWKSNNETIAIVDNFGVVKPVSSGNCIVTAETRNGKIASCYIQVEEQYNQIYFENQNIVLNNIGESERIGYQLSMPDMIETILWISDNPQIATIDENGILQATGKGTTVIRAILSNGKSSLCIVTVNIEEKEKIL